MFIKKKKEKKEFQEDDSRVINQMRALLRVNPSAPTQVSHPEADTGSTAPSVHDRGIVWFTLKF